jgi:hypothetical protein
VVVGVLGELIGASGLALAAGVSGWFAVKAQRQKDIAVPLVSDVVDLRHELTEALRIVGEMIEASRTDKAMLASQSEVMTDLRERLIDCLQRAGETPPPPAPAA